MVLIDLYNGGEFLVWGKFFFIFVVLYVVLVFKGVGVRYWSYVIFLFEGVVFFIILYRFSLVIWVFKSRGSSCFGSFYVMGNVFRF